MLDYQIDQPIRTVRAANAFGGKEIKRCRRGEAEGRKTTRQEGELQRGKESM